MIKIIEIYTQYVLAYGVYIDKYFRNNRDESWCEGEMAVCDDLYDELNELVTAEFKDEDTVYDVMDILARTDSKTKKIAIAENLQNLFDYLS
jgi:hypothetical protein